MVVCTAGVWKPAEGRMGLACLIPLSITPEEVTECLLMEPVNMLKGMAVIQRDVQRNGTVMAS